MRKECLFSILLGIILYGNSVAVASEKHFNLSYASAQGFQHKSKRYDFYLGGNTSYVFLGDGLLGGGISAGVNLKALALEAGFQFWDEELPKVLSGTAFLNFPFHSPRVGPFILMGFGISSNDELKYVGYGLGSDISLTPSIAIRPELRLSMLTDFDGGIGWGEFRLNIFWKSLFR